MRPLGRFHWETWVIDGEQVVDHSTLAAIFADNPVAWQCDRGEDGYILVRHDVHQDKRQLRR
jgi:hypothetical protein